MKEILKNLKSWMIFWIWFLLMLVLWWTIYAAWNKIPEAKPSDTLKSKDWNNLADNVEQLKTKVEWWNMVPSGWVLAFFLESCPAGWKAADGSDNTPDLRWKFIRWLNNFNWTNWLLSWDNSDEDRWDSAWLWSYQEDAIRNITWYWKIYRSWGGRFPYSDWCWFVQKI